MEGDRGTAIALYGTGNIMIETESGSITVVQEGQSVMLFVEGEDEPYTMTKEQCKALIDELIAAWDKAWP